jgi:uncharacterized protein (TIGR02268 family)
VLPAFCGLVPLFILLAGDAGKELSSQVSPPVPRSRQLVIPEVTSTPVQQVRAAPGIATTLRFDTPLAPEAVVLEGREERFALLEVGTYAVTLEPRTALPETGLTLNVGFADGRKPAWASFVLVPATDEVDAQLRVVRPSHLSSEPPRAPPGDTRARYEPGLFARLVLSERLGLGGVTHTRLSNTDGTTGSHEVSVLGRRIHRAETLAVVTVQLKLSAASTRPWVPGEAWLLDARDHVVGRLPVWMDGTQLDPGGELTVATEVEPSPDWLPGTLRLELREKDGGQTVPAGNLKF